MKNRLPTKEWKTAWFNGGVCSDALCLSCIGKSENRDHQFFRCPTAKRIWQLTAGFSLQNNPKIVIWAENNWKGKGIKAVVCKLGLAASDYQNWKQRNVVMHNGKINTEEQIIASIRKQWRLQLSLRAHFPYSWEWGGDMLQVKILCKFA